MNILKPTIVKFHPEQQVNVHITLNKDFVSSDINSINTNDIAHIDIIIEKAINRFNFGWDTYRVVLPEQITFDEILCSIMSVIDKLKHHVSSQLQQMTITYVMNYAMFKSLFKTFKVTLIEDKFCPMTDECLMKDLEFMQEEIVTIKIQINLMKQKGETERVAFYEDLIENKLHVMFQLPSKKDYDDYISKITSLTKSEKIKTLYKNEFEILHKTIHEHTQL